MLLPLLALLLAAMPTLATRRRTPRPSRAFTVMSYNVSGEKRPQAWARLIGLAGRRRYLIFIGLQEAWWVRKFRIPNPLRRTLGWRRTRRWHPDTQVWFRNRRGFKGDDSGVTVVGPTSASDRRIEPAAAGPTIADIRRINWVVGQYGPKRLDRRLVFGSVHLVPSVWATKARELSREQVEDIADWARAFIGRGVAVVLLGDFNFEPDHPHAGILRDAGLRCINHDDGWTHSKGPANTRRLIDHVWVSRDVIEVGTEVTFGHRHDDHRIVLSRLRLR